jgi:hypothetical protein
MKKRIYTLVSVWTTGATFLFGACSGAVGKADGDTPGGPTAPTGGRGGNIPTQIKPPTPKPGGSERPDELDAFFIPPGNRDRPLARMTRDQLVAIAKDLFNVALSAQDLASVPVARSVDTTIDPAQYVDGVWNYAGLVASRAFVAPGALSGYCAKKGLVDLFCARSLIGEFAPLLLQRQPATPEADAFAMHFTNADGLPTEERLQTVVRAMLMAPGFLFPTEAAPAPPVRDHFRLSRLTLAVWNSLPDADTVARLAADAAAGKSSTVDSLLADPRADRLYTRLGARLVDLSKLGDLSKSSAYGSVFSSAVQTALRQELNLSLAATISEAGSDSFSRLLTSPNVLVNKLNAPLYGLTSNRETFETMASPPADQRSGILTSAPLLSILAHSDEGSVVKRGVFVLQRLLCVPPPPPPPNVPPLESAGVSATASQRERLDNHRQLACKGCHESIDGVGFGLEQYDAVGRFTSLDHGKPLTGKAVFPQTTDGPQQDFVGAKELGQLLAASTQARECFVSQLHAALTDRDSNAAESAALDSARRKFVATGDVHQLVSDLMSNPTTNVRF